MKKNLPHVRNRLVLPLLACFIFAGFPGSGEDTSQVDKVMEGFAALGPEALLARLSELRKQTIDLSNEAKALREKAAELDQRSTAIRKRIDAVESFTAALAALMNPPKEPPAQEAKQPSAPETAAPETTAAAETPPSPETPAAAETPEEKDAPQTEALPAEENTETESEDHG